MNARIWITFGAALGGLAVALGAFGAHGLEDYLAANNQRGNFETAVRYQMYHALALMLIGVLAERRPAKALNVAGACFFAGSLFFCGALYGIALIPMPRLGMVAPIGGALFIAGWVLLLVWALRGK
jgi:uncharacterized membrane protein YgdD (TMEM256/DUF423 family)